MVEPLRPQRPTAPTNGNRGLTTNIKELVIRATTELFGRQDLSAVGRDFSPDYRQHSTLAGPGLQGLRALAGNLPDGFRYDPVRVLGEGDLVVTHGLYHGFGPDTLVVFDLRRVADDMIVEH